MGRLIARLVIGVLFAGHGLQKVFGWFGGPGPEGTAQMMENLELRPARRSALMAGVSETAGGALLAAGLLMPVAGAVLTGSMVTAIRKVHLASGLWNTGGGFEYNLTLIAAVAALVDAGPGPLSLDEALGIEDTGPVWAMLALAAGVAGSTLVIEAGKRASSEPAPPDASQSDAPDVPAGASA